MALLELSTETLRNRAEGPTQPLWSSRARMLTAVGLPVTLLLGWVLASVGEHEKAMVAYALFVSFAPGVAGCLLVKVDRPHLFWLYSGVGGATVLVLVSMPMAWFGWWQVTWVATVLGVGSMAVAFWTVHRDRYEWGEEMLRPRGPETIPELGPGEPEEREFVRSGRRLLRSAPPLLIGLGLALAMLAAQLHTGDPNPWGMALSAGPLWFVGAALVLAALAVAWLTKSPLMGPVLAVAVIVQICQAVMYREPTVIPAARHIGIAEFVIAHGGLEPGTDIYQSWSGLFTAAAFTKEAVGLGSLFGYATWWGVIAAAMAVLAVRAVAGHFLNDRRAWLAALVFGLGSSLNTSFFAPQVFGVVVALAMFAHCLALTTAAPESPGRRTGRWLTLGAMALALALVHQLSPYLLVLGLAMMAGCRLLRSWWMVLIPLVPAVWWAWTNLEVVLRYVAVDAFGRIFDNLQPPIHPTTTLEMSFANRITFQVPALALVVIGLLAVLTILTSRTRVNLALVLTAGSPVLLMFGTNYGNEGIFRVVLFALPWLAILACRLGVDPSRTGRASFSSLVVGVHRQVLILISVLVLFGVNVIGLTGMDWTRVLRQSDVSSMQWFENIAPPDSSILTLGTNLATPMFATARHDDVNYVAREILFNDQDAIYPTTSGAQYDPVADLDRLTAAFVMAHPSGQRYLLATEANAAFDQRYGQQSIGDQARLARAADRSPSWHRIHHNGGVTIWRYTGQPS